MKYYNSNPYGIKSFDFLKENKENKENEVERNFKPNYDKRFGLNQNKSKIKNNLTDCLMRFLFFSRATFFRRCLQRIIVVLIIFAISQIGCASDRPEPPGEKLPFGVFPLNDVKWVEAWHYKKAGPISGYIMCRDTTTYTVNQIGENKAELRRLVKRTTGYEKLDSNTGTVVWTEDSTWNETYFDKWIILVGNRVYYQMLDVSGNPFPDLEKRLLYDFNLRLNDTLTVLTNTGIVTSFVASIDNVLIGNEYRKRYHFMFKPEPTIYDFTVIEGVGCEKSPFYTTFDPLHINNQFPLPELLKVYYKERIIWRQK